MPVVVSSQPPMMFFMRSRRSSITIETTSPPSSMMTCGSHLSISRMLSLYSSALMPRRLKTCTPSSTSAAHIGSCVESGLLPAVTTVAPSWWRTFSRQAVLASRCRQVPTTTPASGWFAASFSAMSLSTGIYSHAHSMRLCPSGARAISAILNSFLIMRFPPGRFFLYFLYTARESLRAPLLFLLSAPTA